MHETSLARHGGAVGFRDDALLNSALGRPQQRFVREANATLIQLASAYASGITTYYPFIDGNKRTAFLTAAVFLLDNGWRLKTDQAAAAIATLKLAGGLWTEEQFADWLDLNSVRI
jgi:death-on-curing protein